jgi:hypothetical protein
LRIWEVVARRRSDSSRRARGIRLTAQTMADAVAEVPITRSMRADPMRRTAEPIRSSMYSSRRCISAARGGSERRNNSCSRKAPNGLENDWPIRSFSLRMISALPPPISMIRKRSFGCGQRSLTPRWMSRASSWPEMISTSVSRAAEARARNSCWLLASRTAAVATARTAMTSRRLYWAAMLDSTPQISSIDSWLMRPLRNTLAPRRVTLRSDARMRGDSASSISAASIRTELLPMSIAA